MNIIITIIEIVRAITFYFVCALAIVFCYNMISFIFGVDSPGRSGKALAISFITLLVMLAIDNSVYSIYHIHLINTKIALGATPDPIF